MKVILNSLKTDWILSRILISTVTFYFLKTAFWPLTYLFIATYGITVLILIIKMDWDFKVSQFILDFKYPILLAGIFVLEFLVRDQFSIAIVRKDILLILMLFSLFYFLYWKRSIIKGDTSRYFFLRLFIISISLISVLNLLIQFFHSFFPVELLSKLNISNGVTIGNDYNFFCLFLLLCVVIIHYKGTSELLYYQLAKAQTTSLSLIFITSIVISGSRRALIVLLTISLIKIVQYIYSKKSSISILKFLNSIAKILLIGILFSIILIFALKYIPKQNLRGIAYRYSTLSGVENLRLIENFLWQREPEIPSDKTHLIDKASFEIKEKYWKCISAPGTSVAFINTIFGKGIQVNRVDGNNDGFSLQFVGPEILYYANHTYRISFKIKFFSGDFNSFNVGWWVKDGNKEYANCASLKKEIKPAGKGWYNCKSEYTFIDNHFGLTGFFNSVSDNTSFVISDFELIDLNYDPSLPRYVFEVKGNESLDLWLNLHNVPFSGNNLINNGSFENGKTFWRSTSDSSITIEIANVENVRCALISRRNGNGSDWSLFNVGRPVEYKAKNKYQIAFKIKPVKPQAIPFKVGFWVEEGEGYQYDLKLKIDTLKNGWLDVKASYLFKNNHYNLLFPINSQIDNSQFYITDISLVNLTQTQFQIEHCNYKIGITKNKSQFSDRTGRWLYAIELWNTKFKWHNKLFGHGFDYLEWYGEKFMGNSKIYDWPHNPFITVLLYSGIVGLLLYFWLLTKVVNLYYKYRKQYGIALIGFLITFFFSFFSGGSPFDPPIMGFFMLLPFFIHSIHKSENQLVHEKLANDKDFNHRDQ